MQHIYITSTNAHSRSQKPPGKHIPVALKVIFYALFAIVLFGAGYAGYIGFKAAHFLATTLHASFSNSTGGGIALASSPIEGQENILLLGSDNDQKFTGNPLTQTMMVLHFDSDKQEVDMFSIPRDLWITMPNHTTEGKIDEASGHGGLPWAVQAVEQTFGIPIQHYGWVGLYGFVKGIDTIGGVNLNVMHPVIDNNYPADVQNPDNPYGYIRLNIPAGMQHLDGETALEYVRSRHEDMIGDFGRTERQRQLLLAVKDTVSAKGFNIPLVSLLDDLQGQVKTDMSMTDLLSWGQYFLGHKNYTIKQYSLEPPTYSKIGFSATGQSIVIGDPTATSQLVGQIFGSSAEETTLESLTDVKGIAK